MRKLVLVMFLGVGLIMLGWTYWPDAREVQFIPKQARPFPVDYRCMNSNDAELEFCEQFAVALLETGLVQFKPDEGGMFFRIVVLPTERDGYLSVAVVSGFFYPPLEGLALSAYFLSVIIEPGGVDEENLKILANGTVNGMSRWLLQSGEDILRICGDKPSGLEAMLVGVTTDNVSGSVQVHQ